MGDWDASCGKFLTFFRLFQQDTLLLVIHSRIRPQSRIRSKQSVNGSLRLILRPFLLARSSLCGLRPPIEPLTQDPPLLMQNW
ncbi:hypothetical protein PS938_02622 [Pseudomonas fluorescens]|uniref:Uncharacterized protein n=1 Tax=Pseudomonas fluorescens TaxID=294 RepID=A0A5E7TTK2_PSEFL|nr:hypothetical protein PS938_02622 [Pseudomonas fluorescens]